MVGWIQSAEHNEGTEAKSHDLPAECVWATTMASARPFSVVSESEPKACRARNFLPDMRSLNELEIIQAVERHTLKIADQI